MHTVHLVDRKGKREPKVPKTFKNLFHLKRETMSIITTLLAVHLWNLGNFYANEAQGQVYLWTPHKPLHISIEPNCTLLPATSEEAVYASELAEALVQLSRLPYCLQDEGCKTNLLLWEEKGTERALRSTPVALQRPPSGRRKHNANNPTLFSLFGFLVFLVVVFFFFLPPSECALSCIHISFSSSPSAFTSPLTSAPFWLLPFSGSRLASSTEKSEENIHFLPILFLCPTASWLV